MTDSTFVQTTATQPDDTLAELLRLLTLCRGEFGLILAVCNGSALRQQLIEQVYQQRPYPLTRLALAPGTQSLYRAITEAMQADPAEAVMVTNLEALPNVDQLLGGANQIREEFRRLQQPLVLWITDQGLQRLMRDTPDLYSWADTVEFATPAAAHLAFLHGLTEQVWARVLNSRENQFLSRTDLDLAPGSPQVSELTLALAALEQQQVALPPELAADLAFLQGRMADQPAAAREGFEASLAQWQALVPAEADPAGPAHPQAQERVGHLWFYLGLWWRDHAVRHRATTPESLAQAESYFEQAVSTFERLGRPELAATYINYWAETLQRQGKGDELAAVVMRALPLHQQYSDALRQARLYGFWAEADLARGNPQSAQEHAKRALALQDQGLAALAGDRQHQALLDWEQAFSRGWYLYSLGKATGRLGDRGGAIAHLETAKAIARSDYDPDLYRHILADLAQAYFDRGDYRLAFDTRETQAAIESRFNFRAFIGAGRIQPKQSVANPALPTLSPVESIAPEIIASGREADVHQLVQRIERDDKRFTVIYGPSGVGKSS
ncbi:MAG TPA: tetratricopeptide repeat protein, partial [Nodosilinea sp.]|nr:tetratricopeptide repeat protein [Nodosilinea sp.]